MPESVAFDRAAEFYDETRAFPPGSERRAADLLRETGSLTPESRVLEVGVGTGRIALPLSRHVHAIYGLDLARPMMERLRQKQTNEPVYLVEGDATRIPFGDATFDAVVAVHVFHLIPDWKGAVQEVARVLKPGAVLVNAWTENFHRESWWSTWNAVIPPQHRARFGLDFSDHRTFLTTLAWTVAREPVDMTYSYQQSPNGFLDQLRRRIWSTTWHLSDAELTDAVATLRDALQREHDDLDTPIDVTTGFCVGAYRAP